MILKDCDKAYNIMLLLLQNHLTETFEIFRYQRYLSGLWIVTFYMVIWDPDPDLDQLLQFRIYSSISKTTGLIFNFFISNESSH